MASLSHWADSISTYLNTIISVKLSLGLTFSYPKFFQILPPYAPEFLMLSRQY